MSKTYLIPSPRFRLPSTFIPHHYDLKLRPILENIPEDCPQWSSPGEVTIYGTCIQSVTNITLHSQVVINEASVRVTDLDTSQALLITRHEYDEERMFYTIQLGQALDVDVEYSIHVEFVAQIYTDLMKGMYRNHYDDPETGEKKYSVITQFQRFGARRVFPCFDEPAMKATFRLALGRQPNFSTLSNSELFQTIPNPELDGWYWDEYNDTLKMSTYLVAFVISDFAFEEASPGIYHKPIRTYAPKHLIKRGDGKFASEVAAKGLHFFENFFGVEYSLMKLDSVAVQDFTAGGMENWGLNIYKENRILYSPSQNHEGDRRGILNLMHHELAHQWVGNLATCDWWTMFWLNEGFATYLSYLGWEYTNPEFEPRKAFQFNCMQKALRNDVLDDGHPTVMSEEGRMTYNRNLVYSKGAAVIRMMEGFLTLDTLKKGLQSYIRTYSFQATNQDPLFEILTDQANIDNRLPVGATIKDIMDTWTLQKGFPLVKASLIGDFVVLTQEDYKPENDSRIYYIPIAIATESNPNLDNTMPQHWLYNKNDTNIPHNASGWIVINSGGIGYYRVEYDDLLTQRLQTDLELNHKVFSVGTRSQLLDDYFTFAFDRGNATDIEKALGFTKYLGKEIESSVWNPFFFHMKKTRTLVLGRPGFEATKSYILSKVSGALRNIRNSGADLDIGAANLFYTQLVDWSVALGSEEIMALAFDYYEHWKLNPDVNPYGAFLNAEYFECFIRESIHCAAIGADSAPQENFDFAMTAFKNESAKSRTQIIKGLTCRSDYNTLNRLFGVVTGASGEIPKEYSSTVVSSIASVYNNFESLIQILDLNFDVIVEYQGSPGIIAKTISFLCSTHSTTVELDKINQLISIHTDKFKDPEDIRILHESVTILMRNIEWLDTYGTIMNNWFGENV